MSIILRTLAQKSRDMHPSSNTTAAFAPSEEERLPMLQRGVKLVLLRNLFSDLVELKRRDIDSGQFLNGVHTTDSATDWKEFDRERDAYSGKACCLHTGVSFVETMIDAGLTHDPATGMPYFSDINTFVSYSWRGSGASLADLIVSVDDTLTTKGHEEDCAIFLDVLACAQHRGNRPDGSCPNAVDCGKFEEIIGVCSRTVFFATPLQRPTAFSRAWCLYEVMKTSSNGKDLLVALDASDRERLKKLVIDDFDSIVTMFMSIKSEKAEATLEEDRAKIFGWIKRDLGADGFKKLDHIVGNGMRAWMAETGAQLAEDSDDAGLLLSVGRMFDNLARFTEAEMHFRRVLKIQEEKDGLDHPEVGATLRYLVRCLTSQGNHTEALLISQRALTINESTYGSEHQEVADSLLLVANSYTNQGSYAEARPLLARALSIIEKVKGPNHPETAHVLIFAADVLVKQCKYSEAEPITRRALRIREMNDGSNHPEVAGSLANMAVILDQQGKLTEAEAVTRRSLAIEEAAHGLRHPRVAVSLNNLAYLLVRQGKLADAEPIYRVALDIRESKLGLVHPHVATTLNNLANLLSDQGKFTEAEHLYRRALDIREEKRGPGHPEVATTLDNFASSLETQGRYDEAEPFYNRALVIREAKYGPDHPEVASTLKKLANFLRIRGRFNEAEPMFRRILVMCEAKHGQYHPEVAAVLRTLAIVVEQLGDSSESNLLGRRALAIDEAEASVPNQAKRAKTAP